MCSECIRYVVNLYMINFGKGLLGLYYVTFCCLFVAIFVDLFVVCQYFLDLLHIVLKLVVR